MIKTLSYIKFLCHDRSLEINFFLHVQSLSWLPVRQLLITIEHSKAAAPTAPPPMTIELRPLLSGNAPLAWERAPPRGIFFPLDEQTFLVENFWNGLVCLVFLLKNTKKSQQLCVLIAVMAKPFPVHNLMCSVFVFFRFCSAGGAIFMNTSCDIRYDLI